jgi:inosose dehydratase
MPSVSRRDFLGIVSAGLAAGTLPARWRPGAPRIRVGCAAITWGGNDLLAIDEIAAVGYSGIQLRANILTSFGDRPAALRDLLAQRNLTFVALSSGAVRLEPAREAEVIAEHVARARFLKASGGLYLQLTDQRPAGRAVSAEDCARLGHLLTEIGKRTAEIGVPVAYHPHMGAVGETPSDTRRIFDAADPRYVRLLLDVAHFQQGGGDPVSAIREYRDRLLFLHLKDLESPVPGAADRARSYRFVELGRGKVDVPAIVSALREIGFDGWAVVELDSVPDRARTPRESAAISKRYLDGVLPPAGDFLGPAT